MGAVLTVGVSAGGEQRNSLTCIIPLSPSHSHTASEPWGPGARCAHVCYRLAGKRVIFPPGWTQVSDTSMRQGEFITKYNMP